MSNTKRVKELMIPLEDYPHIPYWFTLRQAMAIVREAAIKFEGTFEPRAVLVFDEKYQLMGMLTLRDIIKGLEPRFMHETALVKADPNLALLMGDLFGPGLKEASQKPVSEVMSPIKVTVQGERPHCQGRLPDDQGKRGHDAGDPGQQSGRDDSPERSLQRNFRHGPGRLSLHPELAKHRRS